MLHVSFAISTNKSSTRKKTKKMHFYLPDFLTGKKALTSFRDHQQSECRLAALTFEATTLQCHNVTAIANLFIESKDNKKGIIRMFTKKACRIMITSFLLSFSIYLVSLSLHTKHVYNILFKRHLIFVANVNPIFFITKQPWTSFIVTSFWCCLEYDFCQINFIGGFRVSQVVSRNG